MSYRYIVNYDTFCSVLLQVDAQLDPRRSFDENSTPHMRGLDSKTPSRWLSVLLHTSSEHEMLTEKDLLVGTCAGQCLPSQFELLKRGTRLALEDFEGRHWAQVRKYSEASHTWDRPVQVCENRPNLQRTPISSYRWAKINANNWYFIDLQLIFSFHHATWWAHLLSRRGLCVEEHHQIKY